MLEFLRAPAAFWATFPFPPEAAEWAPADTGGALPLRPGDVTALGRSPPPALGAGRVDEADRADCATCADCAANRRFTSSAV